MGNFAEIKEKITEKFEDLTSTVQEKLPDIKESIQSKIPVVKSKFDDTINFCKSKFISKEDQAEIYALYDEPKKEENEDIDNQLPSQIDFQSTYNQFSAPDRINAQRQINDKDYIRE